jgi:tRNA (cytidine32/uridine32-2'-O)-methyltransferase
MRERLRIVLHQPGVPGNLGSIARAVAHLGLADIVIVGSSGLKDQPEARLMAVHVPDVLDGFEETEDLESALEGCDLVLGTSARPKTDDLPPLDPEVAVALAGTVPGRVALLFGSEKYGLSTEMLRRCDQVVRLPSRRPGESFNLAQAVLLLGWEFSRTRTGTPVMQVADGRFRHRFRIDDRLESALVALGVLRDHHRSKKLMTARRLLARLSFSDEEAALLRQVASKVALKLGLRSERTRGPVGPAGPTGDETPLGHRPDHA